MNYVDDIATTLRRIAANIPLLTEEEKTRVVEYFRQSDPSLESVLTTLGTK